MKTLGLAAGIGAALIGIGGIALAMPQAERRAASTPVAPALPAVAQVAASYVEQNRTPGKWSAGRESTHRLTTHP